MGQFPGRQHVGLTPRRSPGANGIAEVRSGETSEIFSRKPSLFFAAVRTCAIRCSAEAAEGERRPDRSKMSKNVRENWGISRFGDPRPLPPSRQGLAECTAEVSRPEREANAEIIEKNGTRRSSAHDNLLHESWIAQVPLGRVGQAFQPALPRCSGFSRRLLMFFRTTAVQA